MRTSWTFDWFHWQRPIYFAYRLRTTSARHLCIGSEKRKRKIHSICFAHKCNTRQANKDLILFRPFWMAENRECRQRLFVLKLFCAFKRTAHIILKLIENGKHTIQFNIVFVEHNIMSPVVCPHKAVAHHDEWRKNAENENKTIARPSRWQPKMEHTRRVQCSMDYCSELVGWLTVAGTRWMRHLHLIAGAQVSAVMIMMMVNRCNAYLTRLDLTIIINDREPDRMRNID